MDGFRKFGADEHDQILIHPYRVSVRVRATKRNGLLICAGNGRTFALGADHPLKPPFSDMPNDNFVAPDCMASSDCMAIA